MELGQLISGLGIRLVAGSDRTRVCDLSEDSRTVLPGSLFVARRGTKTDGRAFARDAAAAGASVILTDEASSASIAAELCQRSAVGVGVVAAADVELATAQIAERYYGNPSRKLRVIAVTGTNGKTTTSSLIWRMLNAAGKRCGLIGTVMVDDGREVAPASMTTLPAIELSRSLSSMAEHGCGFAAIEASSHALHQKRVDGTRLTCGIFTNLTGDHLDYHKTMEQYGAAKARLFALLDAGGTAIINADDAAAEGMVKGCGANVLRCSLRNGDCTARAVSSSMRGMDLELSGPWGKLAAFAPLIGAYNVMNVLQACAACWAEGLTASKLGEAIRAVGAPAGRLEPVQAPGVAGPSVFVDYAHTDDALRNVLSAVREAMLRDGSAGRLWVVFGCGGDKDRTKRPRMGLAASERADRVVVTSDNPRSERPGAIVDEVLSGVPRELRGKVEVQVERAQAIRHAVEQAAPEDVVVIAGKGHETEQEFIAPDGRVMRNHFDDREVAAAALRERKAEVVM